jgi:predicted CXXCH cytochrome family protein
MSDQTALLKRPDVIVCRDCHEDVVAAATARSGHAPAAESCINCHQPHVSDAPSLLMASAKETCEMCHDVSDEDLVSAHLGAELARLDCLGCHDPHGTGHPSLLARNLHAPLLNGCETCHEETYDTLVSDGESALCLICHDDIGDLAERAGVRHDALELARCVDCHNPHAAAQPSLVKSPAGAVCADCHADQMAGEDEVAHRVIESIGCEACHEPHGGENPKLLRLEGDQLCLACHDPRSLALPKTDPEVLVLGKFRMATMDARSMASLRLSEDRQQGHPIARHRVAGQPTREELQKTETTFKDEMTCLTCHDPHKGRSSKILLWEASTSMDACMHCHPK